MIHNDTYNTIHIHNNIWWYKHETDADGYWNDTWLDVKRNMTQTVIGTVEHDIDLYHELSDLGNNLTLVIKLYQLVLVCNSMQTNTLWVQMFTTKQYICIPFFFKKRLTIFNHFMIFYDKIVWTVSLGWESTD